MWNHPLQRIDLLGHSNWSCWRGRLPSFDCSGQACNQRCGDEIRIEVQVEDGTVGDIRYEGRGCFVSQGAASVLCQNVVGKPIGLLSKVHPARILGFAPETLGDVRQWCALTGYLALENALKDHWSDGVPGSQWQWPDGGTALPDDRELLGAFPPHEGADRLITFPSSSQLVRRASSGHNADRQLEDLFDAVYCVNLDRRPDRWERFRRQVPADWPLGDIQRFPGIDGRLVPAPDWWHSGAGAWGCYRSHLILLEQALNSGMNSVLVLEDDAVFCADFARRTAAFFEAVPEDWGMVYLGGQHLAVNDTPPEKVNELVYRPYNVNRTHAYGLRGPTLAKVYQHLCRSEWSKGHHVDHHLGVLHQTRTEPIYCPHEWLVGQEEGPCNISGRLTPQRYWTAAGQLDLVHPEDELFVAVLGLHSSGSSCLAGVLYHLGLHLGNKLTGYYGNNPAGNSCGFEAVGLRDLCEAVIPFPATTHKLPRGEAARRLRQWINEKRREAVGRETVAAGKYPQLCQLGHELIDICGAQLRVIFADRPLESSIKSLQRRCPNRGPQQLARHQHWLEDGKRALSAALPPQQQLRVSYDQLLDDVQGETMRIADFLGLSPTDCQLKAVREWVAPSKRHIRA